VAVYGWLTLSAMIVAGAGDFNGSGAESTRNAAPWRWRASADGVSVLEFSLIRGHIEAETTEGTDLEIEVLRSARRGDPYDMMLDVTRSSGALTVTDRYRPLSRLLWRECLPPDEGRGDYWHTDTRASVRVRLPRSVGLVIRLLQGEVEVAVSTGLRTVVVNDGTVRGERSTP
jgi:hypothetical protein